MDNGTDTELSFAGNHSRKLQMSMAASCGSRNCKHRRTFGEQPIKIAGTDLRRIKPTREKGQTKRDKRSHFCRFLQIFAFPWELQHVRSADFCRKPQIFAEKRRLSQKPVCPIQFVPFNSTLKPTPDPNTFEKYRNTPPISIVSCFCTSTPSSWQKVVHTSPICITIRLPFVLRYFCKSIWVRGRRNTPKDWRLPEMNFRNARLFIILFVHHLVRLCS